MMARVAPVARVERKTLSSQRKSCENKKNRHLNHRFFPHKKSWLMPRSSRSESFSSRSSSSSSYSRSPSPSAAAAEPRRSRSRSRSPATAAEATAAEGAVQQTTLLVTRLTRNLRKEHIAEIFGEFGPIKVRAFFFFFVSAAGFKRRCSLSVHRVWMGLARAAADGVRAGGV